MLARIIARIIIGMLRKASTIGFLTSIRCLFSGVSREEKVQAMREADYAAKRKAVIERFNQQLLREKTLHNQ